MYETRETGRNILVLTLFFVVLWAGAYLSGIIETVFKQEIEPEAYGLASRYENYDNPNMAVFLWQGKEDGNPYAVPQGLSPTGDTHGNSTAFSLKQVKPDATVCNTGWEHYSEERLDLAWFRAPVLTIRNKDGGKIKAVYEHSTYRDPSDPTKVIPSLIWSSDTTRVPEEYHLYLGHGMYQGRNDVHLDWTGVAEAEGTMVLNIEGAFRFAGPEKIVRFNDLYAGGAAMERVYRTERESRLLLYSYAAENENKITAVSELTIVCCSPWKGTLGRSKSLWPEQLQVLEQMDIASHNHCRVTMDAYEEYLRLE